MTDTGDWLAEAKRLVARAVVLAARWAGGARRNGIEAIAGMSEAGKDREIIMLRDKVHRLETLLSILQKQRRRGKRTPRYTFQERLLVLWCMEYFQIPRRKVRQYFGIARSTLYRWLRPLDTLSKPDRTPANKTPPKLAALVWEIAKNNPAWGRLRITGQLALLDIFLSASAVRNVLNRPAPQKPKKPARASREGAAKPGKRKDDSPRIPAWYPNHVWSIDLTQVLRWGIWPVYILVAIDHYSRKVMTAVPLEGPNAAWTSDALEKAFRKHGAPKHIISDQGAQFTSRAYDALLHQYHVKPRFGAIGKHGSIAVTERVIETLKYEWLKRAPLLKGFDHTSHLCADFMLWYNAYRPHTGIGDARPDDVYYNLPQPAPARTDKAVAHNIRSHRFEETRVTAYFLEDCA